MAQKSYDKALYRLVSILAILAKDERPTIAELAVEFNVSVRTIQTDIYARLSRFPIIKDSFGRLMFENAFELLQS